MNLRPTLIALAALPLLGACATVPAEAGSVRLGQTASVGPLRVTPLRVLEDSRCPMEARCVWAGQVRLQVRVVHAGHRAVHEVVSNKPLALAGGNLELAGVMPPTSVQRKIAPRDYRFTLRFERAQ
ncbi:hypothetical protein [Novosphingobium sp.]|uniref:hypothetical protein n=1 Tax=Novosphingobium sp. TaxID=1874826 RepID=UPI001ED67976|nr:hypothetical protein [Novosphingobium sp.]MBK6801363.1 hypothetical protein [Novosphingobium sp.]MBK9010130.1 hypothetical protein [Novosphingobium sp.]